MIRNSILTTLLGLALVAGMAGRVVAGDHDHAGHMKHEGTAMKMEKTDEAAVIAAQLPTYPLDTCPISGEKLGGMGDPVDFVYQGRLVRFCCPNCEDDFLADPAAAFAKIDAAVIEQQLPDYPLDHCPVSGEQLGAMGEPYDHVSGTRLVRFCCDGCVGKFEGNPAAYFAKIDQAAAAKAEEAAARAKEMESE